MSINRRTLLWNSAIGVAASALPLGSSRAADYSFEVSPSLLPVDQGAADLCWLAATAVVYGWKDNVGGSLSDSDARMSAAATRLGGEFVAKYVTKSSLSYDSIPLWKSRGGFNSQGQQCLDASGWSSLLKQHGPLITLVDGNGSGAINHVVVVGGIMGDGTAAGTTLTYADGVNGVIQAKSLADFATRFELPGGSDVLFSVMYLP